MTVEKLMVIAAALKAGGYRTGAQYLSLYKQVATQAGHLWSPQLEQAKTEAARSLERGMGPARRAHTLELEAFVLGRASSHSVDTIIVGSLWMLRGAELAALLLEQAVVDLAAGTATVALGATKTDARGQGCRRTLRCSCGSGSSSSSGGTPLGRAMCPVHALARLKEKAIAGGFTPKHPLIPGSSGRALSAAAARRLLRDASGAPLTEHSLRRMGAQLYARRGVPLPIVQFLGRWGSAAIERYVEEALASRAAWAPLAAAADFDAADLVGIGTSGSSAPGLGPMAGWIRDIVKTEFDKTTARAGRTGTGRRRLGGRRPTATPVATEAAEDAQRGVVAAAAARQVAIEDAQARQVAIEDAQRDVEAVTVAPAEAAAVTGAAFGAALGSGGVGATPESCGAPAGSGVERAALVAIRSTITGMGHMVRSADLTMHPSHWCTMCGWRFGLRPHVPCSTAEVNCRARGGVCVASRGQVGFGAA